ncbi:2-phospho-L-lactate transferase [Nitrolancea hollandica]|uniref:LPPG:FO 2-phospho-L-lactate transferase n=1 Tax=Nitrolancea hollandica Lb TaxID=1129897 RepID=I4EGC3_9BACT|nr:2-phospho-L-lactate transferase [Nitrolancea hollandica]CCF83735.1 LPPG:FO 2-phospho-L-lactate transferase [Nitrolancea hollandica Lb]
MGEPTSSAGRIAALSGGVGGAKFVHGLAMAAPNAQLSVIVNTADDFSLFGLHISPDIDTVMYTLAGIANDETGWGISNETFTTLEMIGRYKRDTWFWLGDKDFATHILRTERLRSGATLTSVTAELASALGVGAAILPMCDDPVMTLVETPDGTLPFQDYFVRRRHQDTVLGIRLDGIAAAKMSTAVELALSGADMVILGPSNPIVSIGPILSLPGLRDRLRTLRRPIVAISPIVGGKALKGPADRMMESLGYEVSAFGVANLYRDFLTGMVIDEQDARLAHRINGLGIPTLVTDTVMRSTDDRRRLADAVITFGRGLTGSEQPR